LRRARGAILKTRDLTGPRRGVMGLTIGVFSRRCSESVTLAETPGRIRPLCSRDQGALFPASHELVIFGGAGRGGASAGTPPAHEGIRSPNGRRLRAGSAGAEVQARSATARDDSKMARADWASADCGSSTLAYYQQRAGWLIQKFQGIINLTYRL